MKISPKEKALLNSQAQKQKVLDGTHHFLDKKFARKRAMKRIKEGTHPWIQPGYQTKLNLKRVSEGCHPFLGVKNNYDMLLKGIHPAQKLRTCPHCGKTGKSPGMFSRHFRNCKIKEWFSLT